MAQNSRGAGSARGQVLWVVAICSVAALGLFTAGACRRDEEPQDHAQSRQAGKGGGQETRPADASGGPDQASSGPGQGSGDTHTKSPGAHEQVGPEQRATVEALEREALEVSERLVGHFPKSATPLAMMGTMHARFGNSAEAMTWWKKSLEKDPRRADVHASMAQLAFSVGQYEQAAGRWQKALEFGPSRPGVRVGLARALMGLGRLKEAVETLKKEIEASPGQVQAQSFLGKAYLELGELDSAREHYGAAVALQGDYAQAHYGLSMACARLGQTEQARKHLETFRKLRAAERDKEVGHKRAYDDVVRTRQLVALAYTEAGMVYSRGRYEATAERYWRKAADLDPKNPICRTLLASLLARHLKYDEALKICERVVKMSPDNAVFLAKLGIVRAKLNRFDAALSALARAIDLDGDNQKYRDIQKDILRRKAEASSGKGTR